MLRQAFASHCPAAADTDSEETSLLGDRVSGLGTVESGVTCTAKRQCLIF